LIGIEPPLALQGVNEKSWSSAKRGAGLGGNVA
jgi:hypothetical protein